MASSNDYKSAEKTYSTFIGTLKWSVPLIALVAAIVVILIAS